MKQTDTNYLLFLRRSERLRLVASTSLLSSSTVIVGSTLSSFLGLPRPLFGPCSVLPPPLVLGWTGATKEVTASSSDEASVDSRSELTDSLSLELELEVTGTATFLRALRLLLGTGNSLGHKRSLRDLGLGKTFLVIFLHILNRLDELITNIWSAKSLAAAFWSFLKLYQTRLQ